MDGHFNPYQYKGFTLFELSVTISILAIIATIGYPSIMTSLANMEADRIRREFHNTIKVAKATSFSHRKRVFMCLLNDSGTCDKNGQSQLVLFFDHNDNDNYDPSTDTLIEIHNLKLKYAKIQLRAGQRHYVRFAGDSGAPRGFIGHFKYCPTTTHNNNKYQLSFNMVGGIRFKPDSASTPTNCQS